MAEVGNLGKSDATGKQVSPEEVAVSVQNLTKCYPVFRTSWEGLKFFAHVAVGTTRFVEQINHVKALEDVSFNIRKGERVGIIGRNGSGKSTLLGVLAGSIALTRGSASVNGQLYTLSGTTVGFDPLLSGRQNAERYLLYLGFEGEELLKRLSEIEEFVQLGEYFDQPVQSYSLGMRVRTEFATATSVDADVIQIDEVLGAGDAYWAEKCAQRMENLCSRGKTMLLVSHSMDQILRYSDRVIWLDGGRVVMDDSAHETVRRYEMYLENLSWETEDLDDRFYSAESLHKSFSDVTLPATGASVMRWPGRGKLLFEGVWLNGSGETQVEVLADKPITIKMRIRVVEEGVKHARYLITLFDHRGKRLAIIEADAEYSNLAAGTVHDISCTISGGGLGVEDYMLSFSLFESSLSGSTAAEIDTRQDTIYKSFNLITRPGQNLLSTRGTFGMPVVAEYSRS